jgi:phosphoribosylglycinamide formyltransferase-1
MTKICIFASGSGTDFQSIIDGVEGGDIDGQIILLVCNNRDAKCIERAKKHGIEYRYIDHRGKSQSEFEIEMQMVLSKYNPDLIVMAGWLRILHAQFLEKWNGRIINIHPALLPLFGGKGMYGESVHEAVLASGMKVTGCTVHFVNSKVDGGPIILQECLQIMDDDDVKSLAARVLELEHKMLPKAVQLFAQGKIKIDGDRATIIQE